MRDDALRAWVEWLGFAAVVVAVYVFIPVQ